VAGPVGPVETFEGDTVGSFPAGWSDFAVVDPTNTAPKPSVAVVSTTDRFGNRVSSAFSLTLQRTPISTCAVQSSIACQ
jgi:hypothetical protein